MMKRLLFTAAWLTALCTAAVSCRNEEKQPVRITCGAIDTIEYTGGKTEIPFSSSAPLNTEPVTEAGWISDLTIGQNAITFIAEENTGARRTAVIIINIPPDITPVFTSAGEGAGYSETDRTVSIKVTQKAAGENPPERDMAIEITVNRKDFHSVNVSFIPADDRMTYIARIVEKEYFDTFSSDEEYIQDEVDEFMAIAESNNVDPSVVISANLRQNAIENLDIDGLKASTGYCVYAYGLEPDGSVTTGLCKESVYTDEAAKVDFGFSFEVVPQDYEALVTITTESAGDTYYWSTMTLEDWNAYSSEDDIITETVETLDFAVEVMGDSYADFLESGLEREYLCGGLDAAVEYTVFAFGMDLYGNPTSGIHHAAFTTKEETVENPCTFDITFSEITAVSCIVNIVPSDNGTRYYAGMLPTSDFEGMTMDEAARYFIDLENGNETDWAGDEYIYTGPVSLTSDEDLYMGQLASNTSYTAVVFGIDNEGNRTTAVGHAGMTTLQTQPSSLTVGIDVVSVSSHSLFAEFHPSDPDEQYFASCVPYSRYLLFDNDTDFMDDVLSVYGGDLDWVLSMGDSFYDGEGYLDSDTEYIVFAFGYYGGITTPLFHEVVRTLPAETSSAAVDLEVEVLDGDELAASNPDTYGKYAGRAVIRATLTPNADAEHWYMKFYESVPDMTDEELMEDAAASFIIDPDLPVVMGADWNTTVMVTAIASDIKGDLGKLEKQIIEVRQ